MAVYEKNGLMTYIDGKGNTYLLHPITKLANVDGLEEAIDSLESAISGKAASSHGNHVPATQSASNKVFLRNDNTWQTVTPANIGAAPSGYGLGGVCTTISDWNSAVNNGWYMGNGAGHAPGSGWYFGRVIAHNSKYVYQEVWDFTFSSDVRNLHRYERVCNNGTWCAWRMTEPNMKPLWTNASPTSSFAAQTVSIDATGYSRLLIAALISTSVLHEINFICAINGGSCAMNCVDGKQYARKATATTSGVTFTDGQQWGSYNGSAATNNGVLIPMYIYGIV